MIPWIANHIVDLNDLGDIAFGVYVGSLAGGYVDGGPVLTDAEHALFPQADAKLILWGNDA